jgi:hypothetical protein
MDYKRNGKSISLYKCGTETNERQFRSHFEGGRLSFPQEIAIRGMRGSLEEEVTPSPIYSKNSHRWFPAL